MASLKHIAQAAGVSVRTVNRALKNDGYVAESTRKRVLRAARRLSYRPNLSARALKTGQSHEIGAVIGSASLDELHMEKMAAFERTLRAAGYCVHVLFGPSRVGDKAEVGDLLEALLGRRPAAAALFPQSGMPVADTVRDLQGARVPCVVLDPWEDVGVDSVRIDRQQGVYEAVKHMAGRGRHRVAFLGGDPDKACARLPGYQRAVRELGLTPILVPPPGEYTPDEYAWGRRSAEAFLALSPRPDAIQTFSDVMAMGFLAVLHERGIRVPEEVAVAGFDDRRIASFCWPPLTTVRQPNAKVGEAAAEILLAKIEGRPTPAGGWSRSFPTRLVIREST
ncbi:MAG TPA: LacI family DNA-binding transcriptional regulator [Sumerlaeia bacterium]|nr:LacI family DNA-binding transcriptional regulator [Sumerlaeia bacterium]